MKQLIFLTLLLGLTIAAYEQCFTEVNGMTSTVDVSAVNYQTYEQAKAACYLEQQCESIHFISLGQYTKVYRLKGALQSGSASNCSNVYMKTSTCYNTDGINVYSCTYSTVQGMTYAEQLYSGKLYKSQQEAQLACTYDRSCDGVTKITSTSQTCYNQLVNKVDYMYILGRGAQSQDHTGASIESYNKNSSCTKNKKCGYQVLAGTQCTACYSNCQNYSTSYDAYNACNSDSNCKAVTYTAQQQSGSQQYVYQLRNSITTTASYGYDVSYVKGDCDSDDVIQSVSPYFSNDAYVTSNNIQVSVNSYLPGCINGCQDYSTIQQAMEACKKLDNCWGVTYSAKEFGGSNSANAYNGYGGYQLRGSQNCVSSQHAEISYLKPAPQVNQILAPIVTPISNTCTYQKQVGLKYSESDCSQSQIYKTYTDASQACSNLVGCTGIYADELNHNYRITSGQAQAQAQPAIYVKGSCSNQNNNIFPILYTQNNFGGNQYILNNVTHDIDMSPYQSLYIPENQSITISGSNTVISQSILSNVCNGIIKPQPNSNNSNIQSQTVTITVKTNFNK